MAYIQLDKLYNFTIDYFKQACCKYASCYGQIHFVAHFKPHLKSAIQYNPSFMIALRQEDDSTGWN